MTVIFTFPFKVHMFLYWAYMDLCQHIQKEFEIQNHQGLLLPPSTTERGHWKTHRFSKRGDLREIKSINPTFITLPRGGQFITPNIFLPLLLRQWPLQ